MELVVQVDASRHVCEAVDAGGLWPALQGVSNHAQRPATQTAIPFPRQFGRASLASAFGSADGRSLSSPRRSDAGRLAAWLADARRAPRAPPRRSPATSRRAATRASGSRTAAARSSPPIRDEVRGGLPRFLRTTRAARRRRRARAARPRRRLRAGLDAARGPRSARRWPIGASRPWSELRALLRGGRCELAARIAALPAEEVARPQPAARPRAAASASWRRPGTSSWRRAGWPATRRSPSALQRGARRRSAPRSARRRPCPATATSWRAT